MLQLQLDKSDIDESLLSNGAGISNDLIIILKTIDIDSMVAFGKSYIFDTNTKRPNGAILLINKNLNNKRNSQN